MTGFPVSPCNYRALAKKAVKTFIRKKFPKFFTSEDIEDIVSEVTTRMWSGRKRFDGNLSSVEAWVWFIAKNVVLTSARRKKNHSAIFLELEDGVYADNTAESLDRSREFLPDGELIRDETLGVFYDALPTERDRRFLAWKIAGLDSDDMARAEGVPKDTVYQVVCQMKRRLLKLAS